jgi:enolase
MMVGMKITKILARQILDSRGNPTVEVDVTLEDGSFGRAAVPSGASTGSHEAIEKRDGGTEYGGKGVTQAVKNVTDKIAPVLKDVDAFDQKAVDAAMMELDGTPNKAELGANAILGVSLAVAKAAAVSKNLEFYEYVAHLAGNKAMSLPMPMMNVLNGGAHASDSTDVQEWMIMPIGAATFPDALRMGAEIFQALKGVLKNQGHSIQVGDEGGFAPKISSNAGALELLKEATVKAGYTWGVDVAAAMDVASTEFYEDQHYNLKRDGQILSSAELLDWYKQLAEKHPIVSIEDPFAEDDWDGWAAMTAELGGKLQIVGDDLLVTNPERLQKAIDQKAANAILIKPNQIGSLSETIEAVQLAQKNGWNTVMSHRSGETEDTTIAHLAVGLGTGQIKTGSMSRTDRLAKYNELLRIGENPDLKLANPFRKA